MPLHAWSHLITAITLQGGRVLMRRQPRGGKWVSWTVNGRPGTKCRSPDSWTLETHTQIPDWCLGVRSVHAEEAFSRNTTGCYYTRDCIFSKIRPTHLNCLSSLRYHCAMPLLTYTVEQEYWKLFYKGVAGNTKEFNVYKICFLHAN